MKRVLKCVQRKHFENFPNSLLRVTSSLWSLRKMEGLGEVRGAEGGMESEFHEIPSQGPSQTSQAEYIRAPAQGLPSTNEFSRVIATPEKINCTNQPALTILFKKVEGRWATTSCRMLYRKKRSKKGIWAYRCYSRTGDNGHPYRCSCGICSRNTGGDNCTSLGPNYRLGRYSSMGVRSDGK